MAFDLEAELEQTRAADAEALARDEAVKQAEREREAEHLLACLDRAGVDADMRKALAMEWRPTYAPGRHVEFTFFVDGGMWLLRARHGSWVITAPSGATDEVSYERVKTAILRMIARERRMHAPRAKAAAAARLKALDAAIATITDCRRSLGADADVEAVDGDVYFAIETIKALRTLVERGE